jgi:hypothetical protein
MDVILSTRCLPIAQVFGSFLDCLHNVSLGLALAPGGTQGGKLLGHMTGPMPGAEIFRGEVFLRNFPQLFVSRQQSPLSRIRPCPIDIGTALTGYILASFDDSRESPIAPHPNESRSGRHHYSAYIRPAFRSSSKYMD